MRRKFTILLFGLLLAVGWTNSAQAQRLPAESLVKRVQAADAQRQRILMDAGGLSETHNHSAVMQQKHAAMTTLSNRSNAPMRAGQDLDMKTISKADAEAITYNWSDPTTGESGTDVPTTKVATNPYQMYELLKKVYTTKSFPGPYYSAFTMDDQRERKVYYGAIEGGWDITGPTLSNPTLSYIKTISNPVTVANGTSTTSGYNYLPVYGYYFEQAQTNQMIYTASQLDLQNGDVINSLTFYPRTQNGAAATSLGFSGGSIKVSLANTTTNYFSSNSNLSANFTDVAQISTYTVNSNGEWTINFTTPFTYTGNNILVQFTTTAGTYGQTYFFGQQTSNYQSRNSYGNTRYYFLPKASFGVASEQEVTYDPTSQIGNISITGSSQEICMTSIRVYSGNTTLFSWSYATDGTASAESTGQWPTGMYYSSWAEYNGYGITFNENFDPIVLDYSLFFGYSNVTVEIQAYNVSSSNAVTVTVNGNNNSYATTGGNLQLQTKTWPLSATTYPYTYYDPDYYKPTQEGYTALIVAVKNHVTITPNDDMLCYFTSKDEIIDFFRNNVDSIQLLTDGMRMGAASDYSIGTLFNCEGTYNKFFFLGKGQARQKSDYVRQQEILKQQILGEAVPFKFMFEEFSPTGGEAGANITDFYSKMMEGNVYPVVHDCASVIQNGHQFSMSGNTGEKPYAMTGMNFFIPDYRLKYWENDSYYVPWADETIIDGPHRVDGRIMNPYQLVSSDGSPVYNMSLIFTPPSSWCAWYAQYNPQYAPKVGLYKITLEAIATPVGTSHDPDNLNYLVTLTWVSSLDEMTGHDVEQTYTVYYIDENGERQYVVATGLTNGQTGETTISYYVPQHEHSYIIDYIVVGSPDDAAHDQFIAESNPAYVVIPGWEDFVGLQLDHYESDFEANDMGNYYRNFLEIVNEDIYNGLTLSKVKDDGMRTFNLYRWAIKQGVAQPEEKIATITFDQISQDEKEVHYTINYVSTQDILETPKYERSTMGIPDQGWIRIKGNGDLVIWPNSYHVNFKSIVIKNGNDVLYSWNAEDADFDNDDPNLPNGWEYSPGSKMVPYIMTTTTTGVKVCYMEGGGYIYIPNLVNNSNYPNLTVEIVALTDGANVGRIMVNDRSKSVNNVANTYIWGTTETPISPNGAPRKTDDGKNLSKSDNKDLNKAFTNN